MVDRVWTDRRDRYTEREDRATVDDTTVRQVGLFDTERRFDAGELAANDYVFERAWVIAWPDGLPSRPGSVVSVQRDGDVATVEGVEGCIRYLRKGVGPSLDGWTPPGADHNRPVFRRSARAFR